MIHFHQFCAISLINITKEKPTSSTDCLHYYKATILEQANKIAADPPQSTLPAQQNKHNAPLFSYAVYLQAFYRTVFS